MSRSFDVASSHHLDYCPKYKAELMDAVLSALSMQNKPVGFDRLKFPIHGELYFGDSHSMSVTSDGMPKDSVCGSLWKLSYVLKSIHGRERRPTSWTGSLGYVSFI